mmetsp:Transcript_7331/g.15842  ORF Transcript_7331/g.15842 Transcript_7331/m.15842 type:complete len:307 (+) Transcript_7331:107-1027(+)
MHRNGGFAVSNESIHIGYHCNDIVIIVGCTYKHKHKLYSPPVEVPGPTGQKQTPGQCAKATLGILFFYGPWRECPVRGHRSQGNRVPEAQGGPGLYHRGPELRGKWKDGPGRSAGNHALRLEHPGKTGTGEKELRHPGIQKVARRRHENVGRHEELPPDGIPGGQSERGGKLLPVGRRGSGSGLYVERGNHVTVPTADAVRRPGRGRDEGGSVGGTGERHPVHEHRKPPPGRPVSDHVLPTDPGPVRSARRVRHRPPERVRALPEGRRRSCPGIQRNHRSIRNRSLHALARRAGIPQTHCGIHPEP